MCIRADRALLALRRKGILLCMWTFLEKEKMLVREGGHTKVMERNLKGARSFLAGQVLPLR